MHGECMTRPALVDILEAIYQLTHAGVRVDSMTLARHLATSAIVIERALKKLEALELCNASRVRLTMRGLVAAAATAREEMMSQPLRHVA